MRLTKGMKARKVLSFLFLGALYAALMLHLREPEPVYDALEYLHYGINLTESGTYGRFRAVPDAHREPGYGAFLAILYSAAKPFLSLSSDLLETQLLKIYRALIFLQAFFGFSVAVYFWRFCKKSGLEVSGPFLLAMLLFSPTVIGMRSVLYSESLGFDLIVLLMIALCKTLQTKKISADLRVGTMYAMLVLTKAYLSLFGLFLAACNAFYFLWKRRVFFRLRASLAVLALGLAASGAWAYRARTADPNREALFRSYLMFFGQFKRAETYALTEDLIPGTVAMIGKSTCKSFYGEERCRKFSTLAAEEHGVQTIADLRAGKIDVAGVMKGWLKSFPKQMVSSVFEAIRMVFFEAPPLPPYPWMGFLPKIWHFFGSLLILILAVLGIRSLDRHREFRNFLVLLMGYHVLIMSQLSNEIRYVFPMLPILYFMAAIGFRKVFSRIA